MAGWLEDCPHGGLVPYCPTCSVAALQAEAEARKQVRAERLRAENENLRGRVAAQSRALDGAYRKVRNLEQRLQRGR